MIRVSFIQTICIENDATSAAIRNEILWLNNSKKYIAKLYVHNCSLSDIPYKEIKGIDGLLYDPHFLSSELVIFHFACYYSLFNTLFLLPRKVKKIVVFHNITPKNFMPQEHHQLIEKSFQQLSNITVADNIICDSQENLKTLQNLNLCKHAKVMPLAIINNFIPPPVSKLSSKDSIIRIIFIGRLVKSKGPLDLLSALKKVLESGQKSPIQLDFVSNSSFADKDLLIQIQNNCQALQKLYKNQLKITFHFDATETLKYKLLHEADLFVLPSYHEGFCVPILEALYSGCSVISYNNSNIPNISSNFAILVETGNIYSLYSAINNKIEEIKKNQRSGDYSSYERYIRDTNLYLENFHIEKINKNYIEYIDEILV